MLNKHIIMGRLGADPEIKHTQDGRPIAKISVGTTDATWKDKDTGEKKERTNWHRVVCFTEHGCKLLENHFKKGDAIYIEGSVETRSYEDQSGQKRYATETVIRPYGGEIKFPLTTRSEGRPAPSPDDYGNTSTRQVSSGEYQAHKDGTGSPDLAADMDDNIPF